MPLNLASYSSDSEDEAGPSSAPVAAPQKTDRSAAVKQPRGKVRIHVPARLPDAREPEEAATSSSKKVELNSLRKSTHSLFSALPAPKRRKFDTDASEGTSVGADATAAQTEPVQAPGFRIDSADQDTPAAARTNKNENFRAMLGLRAQSPARPGPPPDGTAAAPGGRSRVSAPTDVAEPGQAVAQASSSPGRHPRPDPASDGGELPAKRLPLLSAAPDIGESDTEEEQDRAMTAVDQAADPYRGWTQGADGAWYPVTPEAIAAFERYNAQQHAGMDDKTRLELAAADVVDVDVNAAPSAMAQAAQPKPSAGAAVKGRARYKGQLGALVSDATERAGELEDKWTRQKKSTAAAGARYGF